VKAIQTMLGHASAPMTLDVYSHLFADELKISRRRWIKNAPRTDFLRTFCGLTVS